jgi:DNA replication protein DnaC
MRPGGGSGARPPGCLPGRPSSWRETDSSIPAPAQHALATLEWVTLAGNLCIAGLSGTGKSQFAEALAHKAIDAGMRVAWFTLESLTAVIGRAAIDGTTPACASPRPPRGRE